MEWKSRPDQNEESTPNEPLYEEEAYSPLKTKKFISSEFIKQLPLPHILAGAGVILVILLLILLVPGTDNEDLTAQINFLEARVKQVEDRLVQLENPSGEMAGLGNPAQELEQLKERVEAQQAALAVRMDELALQLEEISKKPKPAARASARPSKPAPAKTSKASPRYHQVAKGDTLYGIARRYGLTVDQLRKMNGLPSNATIYPGQKLAVSK